jgi:peptide/nickel transport system permease protein
VTRYIIRRVLLSLPVLFGVLFVVFALARVLPGDPCRAELGERATDELCAAFAVRHGLDKPIPEQFVLYLGQIARGDLGNSIRFNRPVGDLLVERLPTTVELSLLALLFAVIVGLILGLISAYRRNSFADAGTMVIANLGVSTPVFVLGLLLAYIFAVILKDTPFSLPPSGRLSSGVTLEPLAQRWGLTGVTGPPRLVIDFFSNMNLFNALVTLQFSQLADALRHLLLPAIALGTIPMAIIARMTRSSLLDVMGLDYIRTARAKGLGDRLVVFRHAMRNALLPVVTVIGLSLGGLFSGAILTETIFNLGGVGRTVYEAITSRDYIVIQAFTLVIAVIYLIVNLLVDISYGYLDPRIRLD